MLDDNGAEGLVRQQAFTKGPLIEFLGREAQANPLAAKLSRQFDCDIHPARCVRLPRGRFRIEIHEPIEISRNENGTMDIAATTQTIGRVIETWVREYPEQWLWLHNRWKIKTPKTRKRPSS